MDLREEDATSEEGWAPMGPADVVGAPTICPDAALFTISAARFEFDIVLLL